MIAAEIRCEWDEDGLYLFADGTPIKVLDPEELYDRVKSAVGPWLYERDAARREFDRGEVASTILSMRDDEEAYDLSNPKHPRHHEVHAAIHDLKTMKEDA